MRKKKPDKIGLLIVIPAALLIMAGCAERIGDSGYQAGRDDTEEDNSGNDVQGYTAYEGEIFIGDDGGGDFTENSEGTAGSLYRSIASGKGLGEDAIVGAAINTNTIRDERLMELVHDNFNAVTLENELKMDCMLGYSNAVCPEGSLHDEELNGVPIQVPTLDHTRADEMLDMILEWNRAHPDRQLRVRGHVLVWHSQAPEWFFHEGYDASKDYVTKEVMDRRLEWYIKSMLEYYTGKDSKYNGMFYGWDVVNEAVSDATGSYRTDTESGNDSLSDPVHSIKSSWWHVYKSSEFILNAYKYANKYASPEVELYYNDYNECDDKKMGGIICLIQDVRNAPGTRIDGFGMQGHYSIGKPEPGQFDKAVRKYGEAVDKVMLTELDIKAIADTGDSEEELKGAYYEQADYLSELYKVLKQADADGINVRGITTWGVIDRDSWLQTYNPSGGSADGQIRQYPLLFDDDYEPKPACEAFL